ncbi:hypothetical protein MHYP_G00253850 [Metynnis hypsauchen]
MSAFSALAWAPKSPLALSQLYCLCWPDSRTFNLSLPLCSKNILWFPSDSNYVAMRRPYECCSFQTDGLSDPCSTDRHDPPWALMYSE